MQFSLRMLFVAVAVVGIGAALWVAKPSWQVGAVELMLAAWVLASAATLIVHTSGKAKAFWLGVGIQCTLAIAILMAGGGLFGYGRYGLNYFQVALLSVSEGFQPVMAAWAFAPVVGLLCVLTHRLLIRPPEPKA